MIVRLLLSILVLGFLVPIGAQAEDEPCTDGIDCLCDVFSGDADILGCEDFEDPNLPNYGRQAGWHSKYSVGTSGCIHNPNPGSGTAYTRFGRSSNDCVDVVQENSCDVPGQTNCVFQGSRALDHRLVPSSTGGIKGTWRFSKTRQFGITMALKFSDNYVTPGDKPETGPAQKMNEFGSLKHPLIGASTGVRNHPYGGTVLRMNPPGATHTTLVGSAVVDSGKLRFSPDQSGYKWKTTAGPGDWICLQQHWTNWGTSSATVRAWMDGVLVLHIRNINMTGLEADQDGMNSMVWNSYYNGRVTVGDGRSGYPGPGIAARYEDNIIFTKASEPVSCDDIGFNGIHASGGPGGDPEPSPPPAAPILVN